MNITVSCSLRWWNRSNNLFYLYLTDLSTLRFNLKVTLNFMLLKWRHYSSMTFDLSFSMILSFSWRFFLLVTDCTCIKYMLYFPGELISSHNETHKWAKRCVISKNQALIIITIANFLLIMLTLISRIINHRWVSHFSEIRICHGKPDPLLLCVCWLSNTPHYIQLKHWNGFSACGALNCCSAPLHK